MIKVLHIYPKNDPLTARYVHLLMEKIPSEATDDVKAFKKMCEEWQPDIIHQYGQVDVQPNQHYRWVVSPFGEMLPGYDTYYAVIARSHLEAERLSDAGATYVETVLNPLVTKTTTFDETAQKLNIIYQKVMNSDPLALMDEETLQALPVILKAAICGDKRWVSSKLPIPSSVQHRLLDIYATLEGIYPLLAEGYRILGMALPAHEAFDCYLPAGYTVPKTISGHILEMMTDIRENGLSLRRLADVYIALLNPNMDEDRLLAELDKNNVKSLFTSVLQILSEQLIIDEGYMPCPPINNAETRRLRQQLQNRLRL
jgi:hypothetical protein